MFWVMVAVVAFVVFGTAAVAAGAGGTMAGPAGEPRLLGDVDGPVRPADLQRLRFPVVFRGYRMDSVDEVLDRLGADLDVRDARIYALEARLGIAPDPAPDPVRDAALHTDPDTSTEIPQET